MALGTETEEGISGSLLPVSMAIYRAI